MVGRDLLRWLLSLNSIKCGDFDHWDSKDSLWGWCEMEDLFGSRLGTFKGNVREILVEWVWEVLTFKEGWKLWS